MIFFILSNIYKVLVTHGDIIGISMITIYESEKGSEEDNVEKVVDAPPKVKAKSIKNSKLNYFTNDFIEEYEQVLVSEKEHIDGNIKVSEVFGGIARLYERLRTTVEYKGEHLLRRNAIERIIRRLA